MIYEIFEDKFLFSAMLPKTRGRDSGSNVQPCKFMPGRGLTVNQCVLTAAGPADFPLQEQQLAARLIDLHTSIRMNLIGLHALF